MSGFRAGFAALLGKPNAGKSTLLNSLVGAKIAAVSALPQTTRERLAGIYSDDTRQIIFVDLPGISEPDDRLNECLHANVLDELAGVETIIHLIDAADDHPLTEQVLVALGLVRKPIILAINKCDGKRAKIDAAAWAGERLPAELRARYVAMLTVSARDRVGFDALLAEITKLLPESQPLYDPESLTDRNLRHLTQEMIREKTFLHLHEELPYAIAVQVEEFEEREQGKWFISATIFVERESQKGMVIGRGGAMLKRISQEARIEIERLCEAPVYLELRVKVRENWRKKDWDLREFGFKPPKKKRKR
ncbi:GTPase Era [soil metagenome]